MGLAASQARLLTITARLADNELRSQTINNAKMRLATQSAQASEKYVNALNESNMMFQNTMIDGSYQNQLLTFNSLTSYSPYNTQYGLANAAGLALVSEAEANMFVASGGNLEKYLNLHGLEWGTTYFDHVYASELQAAMGEEYGIVFGSIDGSRYGTSTVEEYLKAAYEHYESYEGSLEYAQFIESSQNFLAELRNYNIKFEKWLLGEQYGSDGSRLRASAIISRMASEYAENQTTHATAYEVSPNFYNSSDHTTPGNQMREQVLNNWTTGTTNKRALAFILKNLSDEFLTNYSVDELVDLLRTLKLDTMAITSGTYGYQVTGSENEVIDINSLYSESTILGSSEYDLNMYPNYNTDPVTYWNPNIGSSWDVQFERDTDGNYYAAHVADGSGYEIIGPYEVRRNISEHEYYSYIIDNETGKIKMNRCLTNSYVYGAEEGKNPLIIFDKDASGNFYIRSCVPPVVRDSSTGAHEDNEDSYVSYILDSGNLIINNYYKNIKDAYDALINQMMIAFLESDQITFDFFSREDSSLVDLGGVISGLDPETQRDEIMDYLRDLLDSGTDNEAFMAKMRHLAYIDELMALFYDTDGARISPEEPSSELVNLFDMYRVECMIAVYGEPKYSWIDKNDTGNTGNPDSKAQWLTNLFERMKRGYRILEDGLASSNEWIEFALKSGLVTVEQVDSSHNWVNIDYKTCAGITEQTDRSALVAKAEAEYNRAMNDIKQKDSIYDLQLKNIDTEHSSLQQEYDSIQKVINKNIERTMKFDQNG